MTKHPAIRSGVPKAVRWSATRAAILIGALLLGSAAGAATEPDRRVLPMPAPGFTGKIGRTIVESIPAFPARVTAPAGSPNVLLVLTDDVGFSAASTFGGAISTPVLDRLAARGLVYNRFHTTALCSPTRAALLTGRNHHAVGAGTVVDMATGFPGYVSIIPRSAATIAEILRQNGYNTAMFGKHHNVPIWDTSAAGPFDLWPAGLGFEYFYGFIGGETNQWQPTLFRGTVRVDSSERPDPGQTLDHALAGDAIRWLHDQKAAAPDKPFFIYYAPGTAHAPHHAPPDWIEKFRGRFDQGWDELRARTFERQKQRGLVPLEAGITPRPEGLPAWESLSPEARRSAARMMEVYAGMVAYQDAQIGRLLDEFDRMGLADDTLVLFIEGDNGASAEGAVAGSTNWLGTLAGGIPESQEWLDSAKDDFGGPRTYGHFPAGWAWALDTPFPWVKQAASHFGGTRNGLILSWPARIEARGLRTQFHHVIDILPTILEAAGLPAPTWVNGVAQQPVDGVSMLYTFDAADAPGRRLTQYFEMFGNRALYHDGWMASTTPRRAPWRSTGQTGAPETYGWELYDIERDFSQAQDLATRFPDKLRSLQALWEREAIRNGVWPLDDRTVGRTRINPYRQARGEYVFWGAGVRMSDDTAPPIRERSFRLTAEVEIPVDGGEGVLVASGGRFGGWSFYLLDGRPAAMHVASQQLRDRARIVADRRLVPGRAHIGYAFAYEEGRPERSGILTIHIDGIEVARARIERTIAIQTEAGETFDIGRDTGTTVSEDYAGEGAFNGSIQKVVLEFQDSE